MAAIIAQLVNQRKPRILCVLRDILRTPSAVNSPGSVLTSISSKAFLTQRTQRFSQRPAEEKDAIRGHVSRRRRLSATILLSKLKPRRRGNAETAAQGIHAPHGSKLCRDRGCRARSRALA